MTKIKKRNPLKEGLMAGGEVTQSAKLLYNTGSVPARERKKKKSWEWVGGAQQERTNQYRGKKTHAIKMVIFQNLKTSRENGGREKGQTTKR